jgi:transcriptional antiterminator RfaH
MNEALNAALHSPDHTSIPWWCLRTKPKMESVATRSIRALTDEVTVFNPTLRHRKKTARGMVWFTEALFPGYLLVQADVGLWRRALMAATGVSGCVHFGSVLGTIPPDSMQQLRQHFSDNEVVTIPEAYQDGDLVEIFEGPFKGSSGVVLRAWPVQERIKLLVDFLGGQHEVEMPLDALLGNFTAKQAFATSVNWS